MCPLQLGHMSSEEEWVVYLIVLLIVMMDVLTSTQRETIYTSSTIMEVFHIAFKWFGHGHILIFCKSLRINNSTLAFTCRLNPNRQ